MRVRTYILRNDSGYAPNPFHGYCTLACCKPEIRRVSKPGDWVIGITPKRLGNRLAYAMQVEEVLRFEQYWRDARFRAKRPKLSGTERQRCGDNHYEPLADGGFKQRPSYHYDVKNGHEDAKAKRRDLKGKKVLVGRRFAYFGAAARPLPAKLAFMIPGRGSRANFTARQLKSIIAFVAALPSGVNGNPRNWTSSSTKTRASACSTTSRSRTCANGAGDGSTTLVPLQCTFCDKGKREVRKLIAGLGIFICSDCVAAAAKIFEGEQEPAAPVTKAAKSASRCCSFCGKSPPETRAMVEPADRDDVRICNECVGLCEAIIAEESTREQGGR